MGHGLFCGKRDGRYGEWDKTVESFMESKHFNNLDIPYCQSIPTSLLSSSGLICSPFDKGDTSGGTVY